VSELAVEHVQSSHHHSGIERLSSSSRRRAVYLAHLGIQPYFGRSAAVNLRRPMSLKQQAHSWKAVEASSSCTVADQVEVLDEKDPEPLETVLSKSPSISSISTFASAEDTSADSSPPSSRSSSKSNLGLSTESGGSEVPAALQTAQSSQHRTKYLQKLARTGVWLPKPRRAPSHQTIIIFDWDDTLLCSTFLKHVQGQRLDSSVRAALKDMEKSVIRLLELSLSLGHTLIVTNAVHGWVEQSAFRYLPAILPVLERVHVVSARSLCESRYPNEVSKWKTETFLELQRKLDPHAVTNVVALGDSPLEMEAAAAMTEKFEQAVVKTVRFRDSPSPEELVRQQDLLCRQFEEIVLKGHDLKMSMKPRSRPVQGSSCK